MSRDGKVPLDGGVALVALPARGHESRTLEVGVFLPAGEDAQAAARTVRLERADPTAGLLALLEVCGGRRIVLFDRRHALDHLFSRDVDRSLFPALLEAADLRLFALLVRPEWGDLELSGLLRQIGAGIRSVGDVLAAAAGMAELLEWLRLDLSREVRPAAVSELRTDLREAGSSLVDLLRELKPEPAAANLAAAPAEVDDRMGPARGEPEAVWRRIEDQDLLRLFAAAGPLSRLVPRYVVREAQVSLARAVASALNDSRILMVEAGTGVGKSIGYLVPLLLHALDNQVAVVVATKTKNLQAQLFGRDLPLVRRILDRPLRAALVKGRRDYLCLRRLQRVGLAVDAEPVTGESEERLALAYFRRFAARSTDGDLEKVSGWLLRTLPVAVGLLDELRTEHGSGARSCPAGADCFYHRVVKRASDAHLLVANHALVLNWPQALPAAETVVFDEAHDLIDSATDAFGLSVTRWQLTALLGRLRGSTRRSGLRALLVRVERRGVAVLEQHRLLVEDLVDEAEELLAGLEPVAERVERLRAVAGSGRDHRFAAARPGGRDSITLGPELRGGEAFQELEGVLAAWLKRFHLVGRWLAELRDDLNLEEANEAGLDLRQELHALAERIEDGVVSLRAILAGDKTSVTWLECDPDKPAEFCFRSAPIDVGTALHDHLLGALSAAVLTSATLRIGGEFGFYSRQLGFDLLDPDRRIEPLALGSPFDYGEALRFFVPLGGGNPLAADPRIAVRAIARPLFALAASFGGRTLALFNARSRMLGVADRLREPLARRGIILLCPGPDGSAARVLERFRVEPQAVLLGARAFFEGVDLPGGRIVCTLIERIPFESPADPIHAARTGHLAEQGEDGFLGYTLPRAVVRMLQGSGRIVRGEQDRGAVVLLDPRIALNRRYGPLVRDSLPAACEIGPELPILGAVRRRLAGALDPRAPDLEELLEVRAADRGDEG